MKKVSVLLKKQPMIVLFAVLLLCFSCQTTGDNNQLESTQPFTKSTYRVAGNPYLPLWEHLPDGEPRVFEDPDNP